MKKVDSSTVAISTFPKGAELWLTTFLNFCYITYTIPIRVKFDFKQNKYNLQISISRKIICLIRILLVSFLFLGRLHTHTLVPTDRGPLNVLLAGFYVGQYIMCLCYLITMLSSSTHHGLLELINLIRTDAYQDALSTRKRFSIVGKVIFFLFIFIIASTSMKMHSVIVLGLRKELHQKWYRIVELDDRKANDVILHAEQSQEYFPLWKAVLSFLFVLSDIDQQGFIGGDSLVLLVLAAKTLESICVHFISSIRDAQEFRQISSDEIVVRFWKIRRAFTIVNRSLGPRLLTIVTVNGVQVCIGIVWVFMERLPMLNNISAVNIIVAFIYFLFLAAEASNQLVKVSRFLTMLDYQRRIESSNSTPLRKLIAIHEINLGSVGLSSSGFFIVSYSFIAGMFVTLLSNSAIVLQYFELLLTPQNSTMEIQVQQPPQR